MASANSCRVSMGWMPLLLINVHIVGNITDGRSAITQQSQSLCQKPSLRRSKCNVDVSFSDSLNRVGFGMCLRDDT